MICGFESSVSSTVLRSNDPVYDDGTVARGVSTSRGTFSCAGDCRRPEGVVFIVSRLLAAARWRLQALADDYGSSLPCRQDGGAHRFINGKKAIISTVRVEQDVRMINSD